MEHARARSDARGNLSASEEGATALERLYVRIGLRQSKEKPQWYSFDTQQTLLTDHRRPSHGILAECSPSHSHAPSERVVLTQAPLPTVTPSGKSSTPTGCSPSHSHAQRESITHNPLMFSLKAPTTEHAIVRACVVQF